MCRRRRRPASSCLLSGEIVDSRSSQCNVKPRKAELTGRFGKLIGHVRRKESLTVGWASAPTAMRTTHNRRTKSVTTDCGGVVTLGYVKQFRFEPCVPV